MHILTLPELDSMLLSVLSFLYDFDRLQWDYNLNLYNTGCRALELFDINRFNILLDETITLQPEKGNNLRILQKNNLSTYFRSKIPTHSPQPYLFSYSQANMYFKRFISHYPIKNESRHETLNLYRHRLAKQLKFEGLTDQQIADYFGEIDIKNIKNYIYSELWY